MKFKLIVLVITLLMGVKSYGIHPDVLIESNKLRAYTCDTLVYFGLDFSQFYLLNEQKLYQGLKIYEIYAPVWIREFNEDYDAKRLKKLFDAEYFIHQTEAFQNEQLLLNNPELMVRSESHLFDSSIICETVEGYKLTQNSGVGMSLIVEEFKKKTEMVSIVFTFFDIESKEVLFAVRGFGRASGTGMEWHWRNGLTEAMYDFMISEYYYDRKRMIKQSKKNKD